MHTQELNNLPEEFAKRLHADHMQLLGISETMRLAHAWNHLQFGRQDSWRRQLYHSRLPELLEENGTPGRGPIQLQEGWAIDSSQSLPHLGRVLEEADRIVAERAGKRLSTPGAYRSFFQDMWNPPAVPGFFGFRHLLGTPRDSGSLHWLDPGALHHASLRNPPGGIQRPV